MQRSLIVPTLALALAFATELAAQQTTPVLSLRPHQEPPEAAPGPAPNWRAFAAATAAAKERQVLLLLFFTAKW